jgi:hypothetical protein
MNRIALFAGVLTLAVASAAQAQNAQTQSFWPSFPRATPVDGRELIAALDACSQMLEQSARAKCEMTARKTGGQGIQLRLGANGEPTGQLDRFHP